jgi:hypothetical protein
VRGRHKNLIERTQDRSVREEKRRSDVRYIYTPEVVKLINIEHVAANLFSLFREDGEFKFSPVTLVCTRLQSCHSGR